MTAGAPALRLRWIRIWPRHARLWCSSDLRPGSVSRLPAPPSGLLVLYLCHLSSIELWGDTELRAGSLRLRTRGVCPRGRCGRHCQKVANPWPRLFPLGPGLPPPAKTPWRGAGGSLESSCSRRVPASALETLGAPEFVNLCHRVQERSCFFSSLLLGFDDSLRIPEYSPRPSPHLAAQALQKPLDERQ